MGIKMPSKIERQKSRIIRAMAHTPFAAGLQSFPRTDKELNFDSIAKWIEELAEILKEHSNSCSARERELSDIKIEIRQAGYLLRRMMEK